MTNATASGIAVFRWAVLLSVGFVASGSIASGQVGAGQAAASAAYVPTMTFDVASVRELRNVDSYFVSMDLAVHRSELRLLNNSMLNLLSMAYGIEGYQIVGLPDWPRPAAFTVIAKSDHAADEKLAKLSDEDASLEKKHMLQALLAERFKLKTHWETRQGPVYNLVVAKPGRLHASTGEPPGAEDLKFWGDKPVPTLYQRNDGRGYDYVAHGASIGDIAEELRIQLGHPVTDKTGLTGKYDFVLKYYGRTKQDRQAEDMDSMLPMDEAIQQELGLKVVPARGEIQVMVIDHVEKPSDN